MRDNSVTKLEQRLREYGADTKDMLADSSGTGKLRLLELADRRRSPMERTIDFAAQQVSVVGRWCLGWMILWILCFTFLMKNISVQNGILSPPVLLSSLPAILVCLTADDLARIMNHGMLELEQTTKYSLRQIVLLHFLMQTLLQTLCVIAGVFFVRGYMQQSMGRLLVYGCTPMLISTVILLAAVRRLREEHFTAAGRMTAVLIAFGILFAGEINERLSRRLDLFGEEHFTMWTVTLAVTLALLIYEIIRLGKEIDHHETGIEWRIESI